MVRVLNGASGREPGRIRRILRALIDRKSWGSVLAAVFACALIASAIAAGLRVPGLAALTPLPPGGDLDYDATFGSRLAPLRRDFVRETLGLDERGIGGRTGRAIGTGSLASSRASGAFDPFGPSRIEDVHPFTNDDMADARVIPGIPFTAKTDATNASREAADPDACGSTGGTAWYSYRPVRSESLIANTFGTDYPVRLGVFSRSDDGSLTRVGCDSDVTGAALVQFAARDATTYLFQITAQATGGRLVFNLEPTGRTTLISSTPSGDPGSTISQYPSMSADGRYVAFDSNATDLHPGMPDEPCHTGGGTPPTTVEEANYPDYLFPCSHVLARDRATGKMLLISVSSTGEPGNLGASQKSVSGNGRFIAFLSHSTNLVAGDTNGTSDIFVRDLETGRTERVSVSSAGRQQVPATTAEETVASPSMSDDGRYVAFASHSANLVAGDKNDAPDIFVHDRLVHRTERVSVSSQGKEAAHVLPRPDTDEGGVFQSTGSFAPSISPNGRYVSFISAASNLVGGDTNSLPDVFLRDRVKRTTEIVSVSTAGEPGNADVQSRTKITSDGRYVVFGSRASNYVPGDSNGAADVFVRDRVRQTTERISVSSSGTQVDGDSFDGTISRDGRYAAFSSKAEDVAPGGREDETIIEDLYVRDLATRTTTRIPVAPRGETSEGSARAPVLSADARTIAFQAVCFSCPEQILQVWVHDRPRRAA